MFFLLRCAFWIALVFLVVPMVTAPRGTAPAPAPLAAPSEALAGPAAATAGSALGALVQEVFSEDALAPSGQPAAASPAPVAGPDVAVLSDIVRFCGDNGEVCAAGFSAIETLGSAIGEGLSLVARLTSDEDVADDDAPRSVTTTSIAVLPAGTLTPDDVAEPWRGTAAAVVAGSQARLRLPPPDPRRQPQG